MRIGGSRLSRSSAFGDAPDEAAARFEQSPEVAAADQSVDDRAGEPNGNE